MQKAAIAALALLALGGAKAQADPPVQPVPSDELHLVCKGDRRVVEEERSQVSVSKDFDVANSASGTSTTSYDAIRHGQIDILVDGTLVRIEPTSIMNATWNPLVKVPTDGWYTLENTVVDGDQISGRWSISLLQKPQVRIDRHTGTIRTIGGQVDFRGTCEKAAPISDRKF